MHGVAFGYNLTGPFGVGSQRLTRSSVGWPLDVIEAVEVEPGRVRVHRHVLRLATWSWWGWVGRRSWRLLHRRRNVVVVRVVVAVDRINVFLGSAHFSSKVLDII